MMFDNLVCPDHQHDVKKDGYSIEEGWNRCPVQGCLFTRKVQG